LYKEEGFFMTIDKIRELASTRKIQWTNHCAKQMVERDISRADVLHCIEEGEIIEDYPDAFPYPCSLVFGYAVDNRTIHSVIGSDGERIYVVTAYIPNLVKFEPDLKTRRK